MRASRVVPLLLVLAACNGLTMPDRTGGYSFQHTTGFIFHWPVNRLPVRYWVAPASGSMPAYVVEGISAWRDQFLYGEFDGVLVADSTSADVVVHVSPDDPPDGTLNDNPPELRACDGVTTFDVTPDNHLTGPIAILVRWNNGFSADQIANCLERVTVHEVGHSLGIFRHSSDSLDLMAPNPLVRYPTINDRNTVERLYHTVPDVAPPVTP